MRPGKMNAICSLLPVGALWRWPLALLVALLICSSEPSDQVGTTISVDGQH